MPKIPSSHGPSVIEPSSSAKPLTAALRASSRRSAAVRPAVSPRKNGADSIGLTIGKSPAKVRRNALTTPLMDAYTICSRRAGRSMNGKTCLVTGATRGIGLATARALAARGATVLLHGRDAQLGEAVTAALSRETGNGALRFVRADCMHLE